MPLCPFFISIFTRLSAWPSCPSPLASFTLNQISAPTQEALCSSISERGIRQLNGWFNWHEITKPSVPWSWSFKCYSLVCSEMSWPLGKLMHVRWRVTEDGWFRTESKGLREVEEFYGALFHPALSVFIALISTYYSLVYLSLSVEAKHQESRDFALYGPCWYRGLAYMTYLDLGGKDLLSSFLGLVPLGPGVPKVRWECWVDGKMVWRPTQEGV